MIKEPKYMVKFTSAYNDNGTVWYTVNVINCLSRFSILERTRLGHLKKDIVE